MPLKAPGHRRRPLIEPLEPRLLFSATADGLLLDDTYSEDWLLLDSAYQTDLLQVYHSADPDNDDAARQSRLETRQLIIIDTRVDDYQQLADSLAQDASHNQTDIVFIDGDSSGIEQISTLLETYRNLDSLHILTHSNAGSLQLGNTQLNDATIETYSQPLAEWRNSLSESADILLYGCHLAANPQGHSLLTRIGDLTGADVAASTDATGHSELGGDWELEFHTGQVESNSLGSSLALSHWKSLLIDTNHVFVDSGNQFLNVSASNNVGQVYVYDSPGSTYAVNEVSLQLARYQSAEPQTVTVQISDAWDGAALASASIESAQISDTGFEWHTFSFAEINLNDGQAYYIRVSTDANDGEILVGSHNSNRYNGSAYIDGGATNADGWDLAFKVSEDDGVNLGPVLNNPTTDQTIAEDAPFSYTLPANMFSDPDNNDTLRYRAQLAGGGSLDWLVFNDQTLTFSGTPRADDIGTMNVEVIAIDNHGASSTDTFTLTIVNTNDDPFVRFPLRDQIATENNATSFTIPADYFGDEDAGDVLSYSAALVGGGALPSWLNFDSTTRTFSGTPGNGDIGAVDIEVFADDGNGGTPASDSFILTVAGQPADDDEIFESSGAAADSTGIAAGQDAYQSFAENDGSGTYVVDNISVLLRANPGAIDTSTQTVTLELLSGYGGSVLASNTLSSDVLTDTLSWQSFDMGNTELNVGQEYFIRVTASGSNADPLVFVGIHNTDVYAGYQYYNHNGIGDPGRDLAFQVAGTNTTPLISNAIPDQSGAEDVFFDFTFAANTFTDADGDSLAYSALLSGGDPLPPWLTFDAANRRFYGTPGESDSITWTIDVFANDGHGGIAKESFELVIANTNDDPIVEYPIPDQTTNDNEPYSYTFPPNTFGDSDLDPLSYSAQLAGGAALPDWLSFDAASRTFSGTPTGADAGTLVIEVIASDGNGGNPAVDSFILDVIDTNDDPQLVQPIADQLATEDTPYSFQFSTATFRDDDADALAYTAQLAGGGALPSWLNFNSATRTFSGTPTNDDVGSITIELIASDGNGGAAAMDSFVLTVINTNDAPVAVEIIADQQATEDTPFNFQFANTVFSDDDGDALSYTARLSGGAALPAWLSFDSATRTFSGTPANADTGTLSIEVVASDGNGGSATSNVFSLEVVNINDDPQVANPIANQTATEDTAFNFQFAANTFADDDADSLAYTAQLVGGGALPSWLNFNSATRTFSGTPTNDDVGSITIELIASDGNGGAAAMDSFVLTVINTNDAPVAVEIIADQQATEDTPFNFQFANTVFSDDDGDALSYTARLSGGAALPAWLSFDSATRTFSGTPANADTGTLSIEVVASDGNGGSATSNVFSLEVVNVNDDPQVANPIANQTATEDTAFSFQFAANTFTDDDGDALSYSAQLAGGGALPAWLSFDTTTRSFTGTPGNADVGTLSVELFADDGNGGTPAVQVFDIVVLNTNDSPQLVNPLADQLATEGELFSFQVPVNTFADGDGDPLSYSATLTSGAALPSWLNFDTATRTFSGTPGNNDTQPLDIRVLAGDGNGGAPASADFTVAVAAVNDAPRLNLPLSDQAGSENQPLQFRLPANTFIDPDGDPLQLSARPLGGSALPDWLSFDAGTGEFISQSPQAGRVTLEIRAEDPDGASASDTFELVIAEAEAELRLNQPVPDQQTDSGVSYRYTLAADTFSFPQGSTPEYTLQTQGGALPAWLNFDPQTLTLSGVATDADIGSLSLTLTATLGDESVSDTFTLTVLDSNQPPELVNPLADQMAQVSEPFSLTLPDDVFADADGDPLTLVMLQADGSALPPWLNFDVVNSLLSGTPGPGDSGELALTLRASDGSSAPPAEDFFTLTIRPAPPASVVLDDINVLEDAENTTVALWSELADALGTDAVSVSVAGNSNSELFSSVTLNPQNGTLVLDYAANANGQSLITLQASTAEGARLEASLRVFVAAVNDPPVVTDMSLNDVVMDAQSGTIPAGFWGGFFDVEQGYELNYAVTANSNPQVAQVVGLDSATGSLLINASGSAGGVTVITLRATDDQGAWVERSLIIQVQETGDETNPPTDNPLTPGGGGSGPEDPSTPDVDVEVMPPPPIDTGSRPEPETAVPENELILDPASLLPPNLPAELPEADSMFEYQEPDDDPESSQSNTDAEPDELQAAQLQTQSPLIGLMDEMNLHLAPSDIAEFNQSLDESRQQMEQAYTEQKQREQMMAAVSLSLGTGLLLWALRASSLLLALMSMLPLWRGLDPLPILEDVNRKKRELEKQRKDKRREDKSRSEVGYLFDNAGKHTAEKHS